MAITNRRIYSNHGSTKFEFIEPTSLSEVTDSYSAEQLTHLLGTTGANIDSNTDKLTYLKTVVKFLHGDRTKEGVTTEGITLRTRASRLGDIINLTPYYISSANGYNVIKDILSFGVNDGMVHILDAQTGNELMAYIPSAVYSQPNALTLSTYSHQYLVDGRISAYTGDDNKTTIVGTLGTGAKGVYALDVSDMISVSKNKIKWEITATGDYSGLGYTNSTPTIIKLANGDVGVIFSNGYSSTETEGSIYIANLSGGSLIKRLSVGEKIDPSGLFRLLPQQSLI